MDHPWRRLRELPDWLLGWADLPGGLMGVTSHRRRLIVLDKGLLQAERRCTLAHELEHVSRGPMPADPVLAAREELDIERTVALKLIPADKLIEAAAWSRCSAEVADELWVDRPTLRARLGALDDEERGRIVARLETLHIP